MDMKTYDLNGVKNLTSLGQANEKKKQDVLKNEELQNKEKSFVIVLFENEFIFI